MAPQRPQRVGQGGCGGVVAAQHEDDQLVADVVVGQRPPGCWVGGLDQRTHQRCIATRIGTAGLQDFVGELRTGSRWRRVRGAAPASAAIAARVSAARRGRRCRSGRRAAARRSRRRARRGPAREPSGPAPAGSVGGTRRRGRLPLRRPIRVGDHFCGPRHVAAESPDVLFREDRLQRAPAWKPFLVHEVEQVLSQQLPHFPMNDVLVDERVFASEDVAGRLAVTWPPPPAGTATSGRSSLGSRVRRRRATFPVRCETPGEPATVADTAVGSSAPAAARRRR